MHLGTALFYDIYVEHKLWGALAQYAVQATDQPEATPFSEQYKQLLRQAYELGKNKRFFHWELEFPDIFFNHDGTPLQAAGFDVVIGNPPYVRQEKLWTDKPFYQDHYEIYHGTADLFVYFFAQGLRLLRPGGRLAYISSNSWLRANYATALRRYLRTNTTVEQIIDFGNTRVFADAPDLSPAIQIVHKQPPTPGTTTKVAIFSRGEQIPEFREHLSEERLPIPSLNEEQRNQLATLARQLTQVAQQRYQLCRAMDQRIQSDLGNGQGKFTKRLQEWWLLPWQAFREEIRKSFKNDIPLRERNEWEALLREQRDEIERLTAEIIELEEQLNVAVYAIFNLNQQEIKIIEQETKYHYGEW